MMQGDTVTVLEYYGEIPRKMRAIRREALELGDSYNVLRGATLDGMPYSRTPGDSTAAVAVRAAADGTKERLRELEARRIVLKGDGERIREQLDRLKNVYKTILICRYVNGHKWRQVAWKVGYSEVQAKRLARRAVERLGELMDDMPMAEEILSRARDARV